MIFTSKGFSILTKNWLIFLIMAFLPKIFGPKMYSTTFRFHSNTLVTKAIIKIPSKRKSNCFKDSFGSSSFSRSGRIVTKAMCRKEPTVNGRIQEVFTSANFNLINLRFILKILLNSMLENI